MRYFWHRVLQQVYIHLQDELVWQWREPGGLPTRRRNLHCYARQFPDQGHPEQECGLVPIQECLFTGFLLEVDAAFAERVDPQLVAYAQRIARYPELPLLIALLPRWAKLYLVACEWTDEGQFFDVYLASTPQGQLVYLNPHLVHLLPWRTIDDAPRLLVPVPGTSAEASEWLTRAIAVRLWGAEEAPAYAYELAY